MKLSANSPSIIALSGGIGGAKLALGLSRFMPQEQLLIVGNTGDDFEHLGLHISPDLDTLMYTLSGKADTKKGWGLANESWECMQALERLGGETWFKLGDNDLATHLERTRRLRDGESLTEITSDYCRRFGILTRIVPISNDSVRTIVETEDGDMEFQVYFVREQCKAVVKGFHFEGADQAKPNPVFLDALRHPSLKAVVICPSNPFLSIDPILAVRGVREALRRCPVPVIGVSPIVGGDAVKGPTARILRELGHSVSAVAVANYYRDFLDGFVLDIQDENTVEEILQLGIAVEVTNTLMTDLSTKTELAKIVMEFSDSCGKRCTGF
jgi:LPPG:FO 2-phospho-L-lactate transferase|tara:strand:- start:60 stop:1040 length:981 start_codon:yes stop_codon:yes gene_type:complete